MLVSVSPHRPRCIVSKRELHTSDYVIHADGRIIGFVGDHDGAGVRLHEKFSALEVREIESAVIRALTPQRIGRSVMPADKPKESKPEFNTSDF